MALARNNRKDGNNMVIIVTKILLLLLSNYGYVLLLKEKFQYNKYLAWIAVSCGIILFLYVFSLFGLLSFAGLILPKVGIALSAYFLIKHRKSLQLKQIFNINITTITFGFYFMVFSVTLFLSQLEHYDNFSHWAIIVKYLYTQQNLPTVGTKIIDFTSYPIGASLWCYYFVNFAGFSSGTMLVAQFWLLAACFYAMISLIKDRKRVITVIVIYAVVALFNYFNIAIRMNNLLVDFVIPMLALAAIAGIYSYKNNFYLMSLHTILVLGVLGIVKNNSMFFVIIVLIYFLSTALSRSEKALTSISKRLIGCMITVLLSVIPYWLWMKHVTDIFGNHLSKHEVSVNSYERIYQTKTPAIIHDIINNFIQHIENLSTLPTRGFILINLLFMVTFLVIRFVIKRETNVFWMLLLTDIIVIAYYIGILLMFVFSMPNQEAIGLAGFDRYASSIIIFSLGIYSYVCVVSIEDYFYEQNVKLRNYKSFRSIRSKKIYEFTTLGLFFFGILSVLSENNGINYNLKNYKKTEPYKVNQVVKNNMHLNHKKYLIVSTNKSDINSYFTRYVGRYYLYSSSVDAREEFSTLSKRGFIKLLSKYDEVVIIDNHYSFKAMSKKYLHQEVKVGTYSVKRLLNNTEDVNN
ncbi:hypothetical protein [Leuconostoc mesenteroides]|uniref:hypothetical protein n=2 Tax=Leuconostoc mesenteroides TaxID=1245 RepID=UPI0029DE6644|nr:hypothetical protein [Leuconostoc mesenteroides]WPK14478.1 hypothetical protein R6U83_06965 [Leuconostoc mesenteroides]